METIQITNEEIQQALAWLNGQASTLGEKEVLLMLRTLTDAFRENCQRLRPGPIPRFRSLRHLPESVLALQEGGEEDGSDGPPFEVANTEDGTPTPEAASTP